MLRALLLTRDIVAAERRREHADGEPGVHADSSPDGQAYLIMDGPAERVAAMHLAVQAEARGMSAPQDGRNLNQRLAGDRTCVLPGCRVPGAYSDKDHDLPWPAGPTTDQHLRCRCRHHHRDEHTSFTVQRSPDGTHHWATRTGIGYQRLPDMA